MLQVYMRLSSVVCARPVYPPFHLSPLSYPKSASLSLLTSPALLLTTSATSSPQGAMSIWQIGFPLACVRIWKYEGGKASVGRYFGRSPIRDHVKSKSYTEKT